MTERVQKTTMLLVESDSEDALRATVHEYIRGEWALYGAPQKAPGTGQLQGIQTLTHGGDSNVYQAAGMALAPASSQQEPSDDRPTPEPDSPTYKWLQSELRAQAKTIGEQQDEITSLRDQLEQSQRLNIRLYNSGYHAGHEDTVEGGYTDVHPEDMDSYHDDLVAEIVAETLSTKEQSDD